MQVSFKEQETIIQKLTSLAGGDLSLVCEALKKYATISDATNYIIDTTNKESL